MTASVGWAEPVSSSPACRHGHTEPGAFPHTYHSYHSQTWGTLRTIFRLVNIANSHKPQDKSLQIAPSIEEGPGVRGSTDPGRLKEEQKQTQPSLVLSPPTALPRQTKAKCSLGFCRANQVMMGSFYQYLQLVGLAGI